MISGLGMKNQRGATLVVALIMLVLLTLFALSAMNTSNISLRIANNMQTRSDAFNAAQQVIERLLSVDFTKSTAVVVAAVAKGVDVNNDGVSDYNVVLDDPLPTCFGVIPIKSSQLDITIPEDAPCFGSGAVTTSGIIKGGKGMGGTGNSLCSNSKWDVTAKATDPISKASVTVHQGIGVRVSIATTC
jgi:hypothetical protein